MNMQGRQCSMEVCLPSRQLHRGLLPGSLLIVVSLLVSGCVPTTGRTGGTVEIEVIPGETTGGRLSSGQRLYGTAFVEAGHLYHVSASLTAATADATGLDEIVGVVSGTSLTEPVEFLVESSWSGSTQPATPGGTFVPRVSGAVAIEFAYESADANASVGDALEFIRTLIRGPMLATYELLLTDLGLDDNGTSPDDAVALAVGLEGERTGTLIPGDEADYFLLQVLADTTYQLKLESTDSVDATSGIEDRFGQINFGVATSGGLLINVSASAGSPGISEFTTPAAEEVLLRLTATAFDPSSTITIQYAISVVEVVPDGE